MFPVVGVSGEVMVEDMRMCQEESVGKGEEEGEMGSL